MVSLALLRCQVVVIDHICGECDHSNSEPGEEVSEGVNTIEDRSTEGREKAGRFGQSVKEAGKFGKMNETGSRCEYGCYRGR